MANIVDPDQTASLGYVSMENLKKNQTLSENTHFLFGFKIFQ